MAKIASTVGKIKPSTPPQEPKSRSCFRSYDEMLKYLTRDANADYVEKYKDGLFKENSVEAYNVAGLHKTNFYEFTKELILVELHNAFVKTQNGSKSPANNNRNRT